MERKTTIHCTAAAVLCTATFFITYYGGIFYNLKLCFACAAVINTALLISPSFNKWGAKTGMTAAFVMVLLGLFQAYHINKIIAEHIGYENNDQTWGEILTLSNCLWFSILFGSAMLSLLITAIIVYIRERS